MKISILMAVYNAAPYLEESINSVLSQTHQDWELLCVDDCSLDNSAEILQNYAKQDDRIMYFQQEENKGQAVARNHALGHSTGEIVMFLDADDWLSPNSLQEINDTFQNNPSTDCAYLRCIIVEGKDERPLLDMEDDVITGYDAFVKSLDWSIHGIYAVRGTIHRSHPYDDSCRHYSDDNTTRIHYYYSREVRKCDACYYYRMNNNSVTHNVSTSHLDFLKASISMRQLLIRLLNDNEIISDTEKKNVLCKYENQRWLGIIGTYMWYIKYRNSFHEKDRRYCMNILKHSWGTIDTKAIKANNYYKPGYFSFRFSFFNGKIDLWHLFCIEMELLYFARKMLRR